MKAEYLRRYRDIAKLLVKYGFFELVRMMGLDDVLEKKQRFFPDNAVQGEELAMDLEELGPTFIKLGQFLSTRPDVLPVEYVQAMERLQSNVGSFPFDQVREIVENELGMKVEDAYREFTPGSCFHWPGASCGGTRRPNGRGQGSEARYTREGPD
jgi:predicted unusual protein kinase regulating ubiquinone biosynthesis (AarF/ABC1/UbiB family)